MHIPPERIDLYSLYLKLAVLLIVVLMITTAIVPKLDWESIRFFWSIFQ